MKYDIDNLIALNMACIGYVRLKKLTDYLGSIEKVFKAGLSELERIDGIGPLLAKKIKEAKDRDALKKERSLIKKHNIKLLSIWDEDYPEMLKYIYNPPILLYIKGSIVKEDKNAVALVGSRRASLYGLDMCRRLSSQLAYLGITIVSGLARGIDSAAHKGALEGSGRTLAVLGNGLAAAIYPPENKRLADKIIQSGALISEFPMETSPLPQNFPIRNRIISGLSLGVVIVEAAEKSGALITAECALEQGREVFSVPGRAGAVTSKGTHHLIKEGAKLVEGIEDIIEELNLVPGTQLNGGQLERDFPNGTKLNGTKLSEEEKRIYEMISDEPVHIDSIVDKSNLKPSEVARLLLNLEVKRLVKNLPGKNYIAMN